MKTRSISLSPELDRFVDQEVHEGGYNNVSAYFADMVRQRRQRQIEADLAFLQRNMATAPGGPEPEAAIVSGVKDARRKMKRERWTA
jgi:Arc/MetJ-type ribon-helix-helix transcriptional regulator